MAVTNVGTATPGTYSSKDTESFSYTLAAGGDAIKFQIFMGDTRAAILAVTIGGVAATLAGSAPHPTWAGAVYEYVRAGLTPGSYTCAFSLAAAAECQGVASGMAGVDSASPVRDSQPTTGGSTGGAVGGAVDSSADDLVSYAGIVDSSTWVAPGGNTQLYNNGTSDGRVVSVAAGAAPTATIQESITAGPFSDYAVLAVSYRPAAAGAPTINTQPQPQTVVQGEVATFTVAATTSGGTLHYDWLADGVSIGAPDSPTYQRTTVLADNGIEISCDVSDDNGSTESDPALLTVLEGNSLAPNPADPTDASGETVPDLASDVVDATPGHLKLVTYTLAPGQTIARCFRGQAP